jgi:hypothetical protein
MAQYSVIIDQAVNPIPELGIHALERWSLHCSVPVAGRCESQFKTLKKC